jgi:hypothetical protein
MVGEVEWMRNQTERMSDTRTWYGGRAGRLEIVPIGDPRLSPAWIECAVRFSPIEQPTDPAYPLHFYYLSLVVLPKPARPRFRRSSTATRRVLRSSRRTTWLRWTAGIWWATGVRRVSPATGVWSASSSAVRRGWIWGTSSGVSSAATARTSCLTSRLAHKRAQWRVARSLTSFSFCVNTIGLRSTSSS